jgi:hypothetical protein
MRHLPIHDDSFLDDIQIASPCTVDWAQMKGDDRVRRCGECRLHVYNLSAMTRAEAAEIVRHHEGRLCVRLFRRSDGTLITRPDCRAYLRAARGRGLRPFIAALVVVAVVQLGLRVFGAVLFANLFSLRHAPLAMGAMPPPVALTPAPTVRAVTALPPPSIEPVAPTGAPISGKPATHPVTGGARPRPHKKGRSVARPVQGDVADFMMGAVGF